MPAEPAANLSPKIFLIATEESGDRLGSSLMAALRQRLGGSVRFEGVGGRLMMREGLTSLFPIEELSIIGVSAVVKHLPKILRLIRTTADAVMETSPDILVIVDSPDFTHRVAKRVRAQDPVIPIIDYVAPSVWAWRSARASAMRSYVDHVLALLPFEPDEYRRLGGPPCSYVGHPLIEQIAVLRPGVEEQKRRVQTPPVLLVLPGSRRSEIRHHMAVFGKALGRLKAEGVVFEPILPTMPPSIPSSPTGLFWNTRGNIRCELHARDIDATQWEAEGWAPVPLSEKPQSRRYQCQRCSPDGNAIATD